MFDSFTYYIDRKKIIGFFSTRGYNVVTFRMFLIENLGYKNGKEIEEKTGARRSLQDVKLVYKDEELFDLKTKMFDLIEFMKANDGKKYWWYQTKSVLFNNDVYGLRWEPDSRDKLVGHYEIHERFKKELNKLVKTLIDDGEQTRIIF